MHRKLDCECKHTHAGHHDDANGSQCRTEDCICTAYDPAGHNPELENILCPRCRLARLEKPAEKTYICPQCEYVMLESQVLEIVG